MLIFRILRLLWNDLFLQFVEEFHRSILSWFGEVVFFCKFFSLPMTAGVDECETGLHKCHEMAHCKNTDSSYTCTCMHGYTGDGRDCRRARIGKWLCADFFSFLRIQMFYPRHSFPLILMGWVLDDWRRAAASPAVFITRDINRPSGLQWLNKSPAQITHFDCAFLWLWLTMISSRMGESAQGTCSLNYFAQCTLTCVNELFADNFFLRSSPRTPHILGENFTHAQLPHFKNRNSWVGYG